MAGSRIEARDLGRQLPDGTWLWRHADVCVNAGQLVGILGRNGSGKTTLLRTLLGLLAPDEGKAHAAPGTGYVPQTSQLALPFAVRDVVAMGRVRHLRLFGGLSRVDQHSIDRALDHAGILHLAARSFLTLSGGERQLVLIARALASDCQALILDEPFAALDLDNQRHILALLQSLAHSHELGILFSAHHPDHVLAIADAVIILTRGEVPIRGPVDRILTEEQLHHTYGVPVEILTLRRCGSARRHAVPLL